MSGQYPRNGDQIQQLGNGFSMRSRAEIKSGWLFGVYTSGTTRRFQNFGNIRSKMSLKVWAKNRDRRCDIKDDDFADAGCDNCLRLTKSVFHNKSFNNRFRVGEGGASFRHHLTSTGTYFVDDVIFPFCN